MAKWDSHQLPHFASGELSVVELQDFEMLSLEGAKRAIEEAFRVLRNGGTLEFTVLDWPWCTRQQVGQKLSDILLVDSIRRSLWDERELLRLLFQAGFYKIWTGHAAGNPEHILLAKALKFTPPQV